MNPDSRHLLQSAFDVDRPAGISAIEERVNFNLCVLLGSRKKRLDELERV